MGSAPRVRGHMPSRPGRPRSGSDGSTRDKRRERSRTISPGNQWKASDPYERFGRCPGLAPHVHDAISRRIPGAMRFDVRFQMSIGGTRLQSAIEALLRWRSRRGSGSDRAACGKRRRRFRGSVRSAQPEIIEERMIGNAIDIVDRAAQYLDRHARTQCELFPWCC